MSKSNKSDNMSFSHYHNYNIKIISKFTLVEIITLCCYVLLYLLSIYDCYKQITNCSFIILLFSIYSCFSCFLCLVFLMKHSFVPIKILNGIFWLYLLQTITVMTYAYDAPDMQLERINFINIFLIMFIFTIIYSYLSLKEYKQRNNDSFTYAPNKIIIKIYIFFSIFIIGLITHSAAIDMALSLF